MFKKKNSYNVYAHPELMYHVMHAQTSRKDGGLYALLISRVIVLCDVSRVVLH